VNKQFKGTIDIDIRDSVPDWAPFEPPKAPDGAPNVVYIVLDDVGFSAMDCYGGPIETPNIDRIAADGVRYTQWHTTALCSPTRSCLLTGRNHTRNDDAYSRMVVGVALCPRGRIPGHACMRFGRCLANAEILPRSGWRYTKPHVRFGRADLARTGILEANLSGPGSGADKPVTA
jgi:Sulfatase